MPWTWICNLPNRNYNLRGLVLLFTRVVVSNKMYNVKYENKENMLKSNTICFIKMNSIWGKRYSFNSFYRDTFVYKFKCNDVLKQDCKSLYDTNYVS